MDLILWPVGSSLGCNSIRAINQDFFWEEGELGGHEKKKYEKKK
jgi:hypothetical protein